MVVSTYQAASGAGQAAMEELEQQTREALDGKPITMNIFPFQYGERGWGGGGPAGHRVVVVVVVCGVWGGVGGCG